MRTPHRTLATHSANASGGMLFPRPRPLFIHLCWLIRVTLAGPHCPDIIPAVSVKAFFFLFFLAVSDISIGGLGMKPIALQNVVGHVQSVEDLNRTKIALPQAGRKLASEQPSDSNCDSSLSLQPAGLPHQALDLPNLHHHGSQLFKINFSFYASCGFCDSGEH